MQEGSRQLFNQIGQKEEDEQTGVQFKELNVLSVGARLLAKQHQVENHKHRTKGNKDLE